MILIDKVLLLLILFGTALLNIYGQVDYYTEFNYSYSIELANINKHEKVNQVITSINHDQKDLTTNPDGSYTILLTAKSYGVDTIKAVIQNEKVLSFRVVSVSRHNILDLKYYKSGGIKEYSTFNLIDSTKKSFNFDYKGVLNFEIDYNNLGQCRSKRIDYYMGTGKIYSIKFYESCIPMEVYVFSKRGKLKNFSIVEQTSGFYKSSETGYILKKGKIIQKKVKADE